VLRPDLKAAGSRRAITTLIKARLLEEMRARREMPVWRRDDQNRPLALRITRQGLAAIRVEDADPPDQPRVAAAPGKRRSHPRPGRTAESEAATGLACVQPPQRQGRADSKQARVLAMLRQAEGTTIAAITAATGWQPHSVRGFLAGAVRKKLGLTLVSEKTEAGRVYRIVENTDRQAA
jgi:hypothetical protein